MGERQRSVLWNFHSNEFWGSSLGHSLVQFGPALGKSNGQVSENVHPSVSLGLCDKAKQRKSAILVTSITSRGFNPHVPSSRRRWPSYKAGNRRAGMFTTYIKKIINIELQKSEYIKLIYIVSKIYIWFWNNFCLKLIFSKKWNSCFSIFCT